MKILFVSDNEILGRGGGSIENKKYYDGLSYYAKKHNYKFRVISLDENIKYQLSVNIDKNRLIDVLCRVLGHSSYLYFTWIRNIALISKFKPDVIVLGRSRLGFIAKDAKKRFPTCRIITNVDNVELDYVDAYFANAKGKVGNAVIQLERKCVIRDEKDAIQYSDKLIYLTARNAERYKSIYEFQDKKPEILPICINETKNLHIVSKSKTVVFIGSLDYAANIQAALMLINNIWVPHFKNNANIRLIIAGRNPNQQIVEDARQCNNISILGDFSSEEEIIPIHSLMVAPIISGAGMKVKVAETLSMGLMILASDEALVGYEDAVRADHENGIVRANAVDEYLQGISLYVSKSEDELEAIKESNQDIFNRYYSYSISRTKITEILDNTTNMINNAKDV